MIVNFNGKETVVAAALKLQFKHVEKLPDKKDDQFLIVSKPPPNRHHNLLWLAYLFKDKLEKEEFGGEVQGFVTSTGRYVTREEGMKLAIDCGQLIKGDGSGYSNGLFSECLFDIYGKMFAIEGEEYRSPKQYWRGGK